jgi:protein O-GlcNAc transferase
LEARLAKGEISSNRLELISPGPWADYIKTYQRVDISLDPFPHGGGITTCDSLWMGVPIITLSGHTAVGRGGRSILINIGLADLVAHSPAEYLALATNWKKWIQLRPTLRQRMFASPLMNARQFARDVEAAFRNMRRNWCKNK